MKYLVILIALSFAQVSFAQSSEQFSRVRIDLRNHEPSAIAALGLEADHGAFHPGLHLVNDYSASEIELLKNAGIPYRIEIADVKKWYREQNINWTADARDDHCDDDSTAPTYDYETPENYMTGGMAGYLTYEEYLEQIDEMFAKFPNLISQKAGISNFMTIEGRPIYWMKISNNPSLDENEPEVLYTALHHAREPNSLSQTIFYMWYLLENYGTNPEVTYLVDNTEMFFIPMVNPDGYVLNQTQDPSGGGLWRKNAWRDSNGQLKGVDLNRNYGHEWAYDNAGSSNDPDAQTFRGPSAFSEVETQAVKYFCEQHEILITLNCHTFSDLLIHPWGYEDLFTPDEASFKALGKAMITENNFALGTGSEVLGYSTNGDADDWMYGETTTKNKIYSYTPEVGPQSSAFWPAAGDIDFLNKSGMRMNLNMAAVAHHYLRVEDLSPDLITFADGFFKLGLQHAGLASGKNTLTISSSDPEVTIVNPSFEADFVHLQESILDLELSFSPNLTGQREVTFSVAVDNGGWTRTETFVKTISPQAAAVLVTNEMNDAADFNFAGEWNLTTTTFVSAPSSLTDSPQGDYDNNQNSAVIFQNPVDLSQALSAFIQFEAKWDIENDYDYVQIMAGSFPVIGLMTPLCGSRTNLGGTYQDFNQPLYDGLQASWVTEEIDLHDFVGEDEIYFAFRIVSDNFVEGDGFYVDNFEVKVLNDAPSATDNLLESAYTIFPNPTTGMVNVISKAEQQTANFLIKDLLGNTLLSIETKEANTQIDLHDFPVGTYILEVKENQKTLGSQRIVRIKSE